MRLEPISNYLIVTSPISNRPSTELSVAFDGCKATDKTPKLQQLPNIQLRPQTHWNMSSCRHPSLLLNHSNTQQVLKPICSGGRYLLAIRQVVTFSTMQRHGHYHLASNEQYMPSCMTCTSWKTPWSRPRKSIKELNYELSVELPSCSSTMSPKTCVQL